MLALHQRLPHTVKLLEQQYIEECARKRGLFCLDQELDAPYDNTDTGGSKSVMERQKLTQVPQAMKVNLVIGKYLNWGNFCNVFKVMWVPKTADVGHQPQLVCVQSHMHQLGQKLLLP
jgi:hypothetical protein